MPLSDKTAPRPDADRIAAKATQSFESSGLRIEQEWIVKCNQVCSCDEPMCRQL
jgi:hypothetical protein